MKTEEWIRAQIISSEKLRDEASKRFNLKEYEYWTMRINIFKEIIEK